ncbi:MAG: dihydrofolate reductase family protein [Bacteroidota bacterium]
MSKIILNLAVSLDSFIEGPKGEYDWCFNDQDYGMTEFLATTEHIFMGRKSFEELNKVAPDAFSDKNKVVFSRKMKEVEGIRIIRDNIEEEVQRIKIASEHNIWLFGGASLVSSFIQMNLIDELMLSVHPILLGAGKPLFQDIAHRLPLSLIKTHTYDTGLVQLHYQFVR